MHLTMSGHLSLLVAVLLKSFKEPPTVVLIGSVPNLLSMRLHNYHDHSVGSETIKKMIYIDPGYQSRSFQFSIHVTVTR